MSEEKPVSNERRSYIPFGLVIGLFVGIVIGMLTDRLDIWIPSGVIIGGVIGIRIGKSKSPQESPLVEAYKERKEYKKTNKK